MSIVSLMIGFLIVVSICLIIFYTKKKTTERTCPECGTKITNKNINQCTNCGNPLK